MRTQSWLVAALLLLSALGRHLPAAEPQRLESIEAQLAAQRDEIEDLRRQLESRTTVTRLPQYTENSAAGGVPAQPTAAKAMELDNVMNRLDALERNADKPSKEKDKALDDSWKDMSTDKWDIKMGGHVQMDYILWPDASPQIVNDNNYFEFRRLRLVAEGKGYGVYDFRLQMTLEPESVGDSNPPATSPDVKDAYFSMNEIPVFGRWRIGNFFVPFGLEQVTNDTNNMFLERSIPTQGVFTADREVGMALYNCTADQNLSWAGGIFFDSISESLKERLNDSQGYRLSGRLSYLPYYDEPSNGRYMLYTGVGILYTDDQDNIARFRSRPQIHEGPRMIDSGPLPADNYCTANAEFAAVYGSFAIQSEMYLSQVNLINGDPVTLNGCYVHMSYFLTGENRVFERFGQHGAQFGRNVPFTNFFLTPGGKGWGGWELKGRWSHLDLNNVDRGQYNDFTLGFNWYWSDRTRVMFDWIHPITSSEAVFGAANADIMGMRFDFNW